MKLPIHKVIFFTIFAFLLAGNIKANTERDSLLNLLNKHKQEDTVRVNLLLDIAWTYWYDTRQSIPFVEEALTLSEKLAYTRGIVYSKYRYIKYLIDEGKNDTAKIIANEILDLSKIKNYKQGICLAWLSFLQCDFWSGNYESSVKFFEKIKSECIGSTDKSILMSASYFASAGYAILGNKNKAEECSNYAKPYFDELKRKSIITSSLYNISLLYSLILNDYEKSNKSIIKLLEIFRELDDLEGEAIAYKQKGLIEHQFGNYSKYLENTYYAFEIYQKLGNKVGIAESTESLCWIYYVLNDYEKSKYYGLYSLKLCKKLNKKGSIANNLNSLGFIYTEQDSLENAHNYFSESLKLSIEISSTPLTRSNFVGLALVADGRNQFNKAHEYYKKALQFKKWFVMRDISSTYSSIANHYFLMKDYNKALQYADSALIISKEIDAPDLTKKASEVLHKIYAIKKNYHLAYKYFLIYNQMNDSIKEYEANELGLIYEFEQTIRKKELEQKQKDLLKEQELKQQKTIRNLFIAGFVILLLLSMLILRNYRQKQKANKLLKAQKNEIQEKNEVLKEQKEEILTANEELVQQKEEIIAQRDEVEAQRDEIEAQRNLALDQKDQIENQNKSITDSIIYAKRIQSAILPPEAHITELLHENFIFYKPRDIVSGDFYWIKQVNQYIILVAADCTGHGVPGAFMSMLGISYLNEIVQRREITQANEVLNELRSQIKHSLRQHGQREESKDGMDIALCAIDIKTKMMQYAGAFNPLYLIRDVNGKPELKEIKADRMPVGFYHGKDKTFTNHEIQLEMGDTFYIFSDGFLDQTGGKEDKKYLSKNFKKLLLEIHEEPMYQQKEILDKTLKGWMEGYSQIDDILVIGVRV